MLSEKEELLFNKLKFDPDSQYKTAFSLYKEAVIFTFLFKRNKKAEKSLRRCFKALLTGKVLHGTKEFDKLIKL